MMSTGYKFCPLSNEITRFFPDIGSKPATNLGGEKGEKYAADHERETIFTHVSFSLQRVSCAALSAVRLSDEREPASIPQLNKLACLPPPPP